MGRHTSRTLRYFCGALGNGWSGWMKLGLMQSNSQRQCVASMNSFPYAYAEETCTGPRHAMSPQRVSHVPGDCMRHSFNAQAVSLCKLHCFAQPARKSPSLAKLFERGCPPSSDNGQMCLGRCNAKSCPCWGPVAAWCSAAMSQ